MSADDLLLTSIEAKILKKNIEGVGTHVLESFHEIRSSLQNIRDTLGEHSELLGNMFTEVRDIRTLVDQPKINGSHHVKPPPRPSRPEKHEVEPPPSERPSVPPAFADARGITVTSTGRFRVDGEFLAGIEKKIEALDAKAKAADEEAAISKGVAVEIQKAKERLEKTIGLVWKIGGGIAGLAVGCYGLWTWLAHHVH